MGEPRVVVTGFAAICPAGSSIQETWSAVRSSRPPRRLNADDGYASLRAGELDFSGLPIRKKELGRMHRGDALAVVAAVTAGLHAGWSIDDFGEKKGLYVGTSKDTSSNRSLLQLLEPVDKLGYTAGATPMVENATRYLTPFALLDAMPNLALHYISDVFKLHGDNCCFLNPGAAGASSIAVAYRAIRRGAVRSALAGGFDSALDRLNLARFGSLGLLSRCPGDVACRPFDQNRDGFVLAEGAAMLVLEDREFAVARGAKIYGEILGVGAACDASDEAVHSGPAVAGALKQALSSAKLDPRALGFVVADGAGTKEGDRAESEGIRQALDGGWEEVPVTALKGVFGHALAAASPLEIIVALHALDCGEIPPTCGCETQDDECALRLVRDEVLETQTQRAAVVSVGFGGEACAIVLGRGDAACGRSES